MNKRSATLVFALIVATLPMWAQGPNNSGTYYQPANGKSRQALKTALYNIIKSPSVVSYDGLIDAYKKTDTRADGYVRDWYSNVTNFRHGTDKAGSYSEEGDCYNREHSIPQSWFSKASPMRSDIMHVIPTDGYVNNRRSSYPFGEVGEVTYQSKNGYSKLGRCKTDGYSGIVFEPNDEVKGDIARIYFYMATCYEDKILNWQNGTSSSVISGSKYQPYSQWTFDMLMRWSKQDPVDDVERDRNNAVYGVQKNRNPFVDYPGLEELVWGNRKTESFDYTHYDGTQTTIPAPTFSEPSGTYSEPITVAITSSTTGATIFFTIDGSTPSSSSTRYSEPLAISETTTVKAIATKGDEKSAVATAVYTISQGTPDPQPGTCVWQEDWQSEGNGTPVEQVQNAVATYVGDDGKYCKLYDGAMAGGQSPELLIPKTSRDVSEFTATINLGNASGQMTLTYKCNKAIGVSSSTAGVTVGEATVADNTYTHVVNVPAGTKTLRLTFATLSDANARIDDLMLALPVESGISTATAKVRSSDKAYDLQGRPVNSQSHRRGIIVKNGRKYISK